MIRTQSFVTKPSEPQGRPLAVVGEGGEIGTHNGEKDQPRILLARLGEVPFCLRRLFGPPNVSLPQGVLQRNGDISMPRVAKFVAHVTHILRTSAADVLALVNRRKLGRYTSALALGLTPDDIGTGSRHKRSLIVAASKDSLEFPDDPLKAITDALDLFMHPMMQGRAGALLDDHVHPLPGLSVSDAGAYSRFDTIASREEDGTWMFGEHRYEHLPRGTQTAAFDLERGIKTEHLVDADDPADYPLVVPQNITSGEPRTGLVYQTHTREDPFQELDPQLLQEIDSRGIPSVLVREVSTEVRPPSGAVGRFRTLVDGGRLFSGEAKVILAHAVAEAHKRGITDPDDVIAFIRLQFAAYPFQ